MKNIFKSKKILLGAATMMAYLNIYSQTNVLPTSGNVGIGITNPTAKLQITVPSGTAGNNETNGIYVYNGNNTAGNDAIITARVNGGSGGNPFIAFDVRGIGGWSMGIDNADNDKFKISGQWNSLTTATKLTIDRTTGNMGIGTTNATAPLTFAQNTINKKIGLFDWSGNDHQFYGFGVNAYQLRYQVDGVGSNHVFWAATSATTSNELMRITGNGKVGIGTNTPSWTLDVAGTGYFNGNLGVGANPTLNAQYRLVVGGTIAATNYAVVAAFAADYVFENDYKLITLSETEAYIKANKHLPAFKSAKHYEAHGYTMTEMNIALEQTVEELTLHAIAQEKEINAMKSELAAIKAMLLAKKL